MVHSKQLLAAVCMSMEIDPLHENHQCWQKGLGQTDTFWNPVKDLTIDQMLRHKQTTLCIDGYRVERARRRRGQGRGRGGDHKKTRQQSMHGEIQLCFHTEGI